MYKRNVHDELSKCQKSDIFKLRHDLEKHHEDLECHKRSMDSMKPVYIKMVKQNIILLKEYNKLNSQVVTNRAMNDELRCMLRMDDPKESCTSNIMLTMDNRTVTQIII